MTKNPIFREGASDAFGVVPDPSPPLQHVAAVRMGRAVGKDINIDLAKYLHTPDREYCFPIQVTKTDVAQLHVCAPAPAPLVCHGARTDSDILRQLDLL